MTNADALQTLAANLRHAARNQEAARIGGGIFTPAELATAAEEIKRLETIRDKIETAQTLRFSAWCDEWGYSPDQISAHTHYSAARAWKE